MWLHILPFPQKSHIDWPSPTTSLEQFLRAIPGAVSLAVVLILPQIKLNSQLSCCAFFFYKVNSSEKILSKNLLNEAMRRQGI